MGVGFPIDLLEAVDRGIDMFDCTIPSLLARQGVVFTSAGRLDLARGVYRLDDRPLDRECACPVCAGWSRAYLHHLVKTGEALGPTLVTRHNLHFYHRLMAEMRLHILAGTFAAYRDEQRERLVQVDAENPPIRSRPGRRRRGAEAMARFEVRTSPEGFSSIADRPSGEIMHAGLDPSREAQDLYIGQSRLAGRLADEEVDPLVVWDVGLGAAHNAMAALACGLALEGRRGRGLHLVSFENDAGALRLALRHAGRFPHLQTAAPNHLLRFGTWQSEEGGVQWTLLEGDFLERLGEAPAPSCIYFDPFSARTDHSLWTLGCFEKIAAACGDADVELFTYSSSTAVRAAMLAAGFWVARGDATGPRPETSVALGPGALAGVRNRGRTLLDARWLDRWRRSHAGFPADVGDDLRPEVAARIEGHPQFASEEALGGRS